MDNSTSRRDSTVEFIRFMKILGNHPTNFPGAYEMVDGTFELDRKSIQKLREYLTKLGIKPYDDGLLAAQIAGRLAIQLSDTIWVRILIHPAQLLNYKFELKLQEIGLDLKAILKIHDQLEPPKKPETCPQCGAQFLNGEEVAGFHSAWENSWKNSGPPDDPFNISSG